MNNSSDFRILYIEDELPLCDLFKMAVGSSGYSIDVAHNGKDGLALCAEHQYDVVAIDYQLPDMTGIDIIRKLLADDPDLPILMVTGKGDERIADEAMALGVANYVIKGDEKVYLELIPDIIDSLLEQAERGQKQLGANRAVKDLSLHFGKSQFRSSILAGLSLLPTKA